jgi:hypothetical protein
LLDLWLFDFGLRLVLDLFFDFFQFERLGADGAFFFFLVLLAGLLDLF